MRSFFFTFVGRFRASWMSSLFLMIVASNLRSKASKSMYACDSGTKSRTCNNTKLGRSKLIKSTCVGFVLLEDKFTKFGQ